MDRFSSKIPFLYRELRQTIIRIVVTLGRTNGEIAPMSRLLIGDYCPYVSEMTLVPQSTPAQARRLTGSCKTSTGRATR